MGTQGTCLVCSRKDREQIDNEHARGAQTRGLARLYSIPEATLRRHFNRCRPVARPSARHVTRPAPAAPPVAAPAEVPDVGILTVASLIEIAEEHGMEVEHVVSHALWAKKVILIQGPDDARILADAVALDLEHFEAE